MTAAVPRLSRASDSAGPRASSNCSVVSVATQIGLSESIVKATEATAPGDICFEPFSGSGSQIIAAELLGRRCFACEIEPAFVDVAVKRWEEFTKSIAKRAER
jgi:tRNA G10  N-methylase Trm11